MGTTRPDRKQGHGHRSPVALLLLSWCLALPHFSLAQVDMAAREAQRASFVEANEALAKGRIAEYQALLPALSDYPLLPYLEYAALGKRLNALPHTEVDDFLDRHGDSYLGERLQREWVAILAGKERWQDVARYHDPANSTTELSCLALKARLEIGDTNAFEDVPALWNVARSQPNICDPVFQSWMEAGHLTPGLAWDRFVKTLKARQHNLARYVARQMPTREQSLAELFLEVDRRPERVRELTSNVESGPEMFEIVVHGLQQLANLDARLAHELLPRHADTHSFDTGTHIAVQRYILLRLLLQGYVEEAESLMRQRPELISEALAEWNLRDAMKQQDWQRLQTWLDLLPTEARNSERWQYWRARNLARQGTAEAQQQAREIYQSLAQTRNFYGFLAADLLGMDYQLEEKPAQVSEAEFHSVAMLPAMQRAQELYAIGDEPAARREWQHATRRMETTQLLAAGKLADSWGWHRNSIQAMIQASYWDDLQLRFPLAYDHLVERAARDNALPPQLLFAVARQESAFMHDVRSPAGALGLMQLMPATAQQTASGVGMRINNQDLLKPEVNIPLGTRYLAQMLQEFNGNRILAAAAYNAGPNRVRQWLNQEGNRDLPFDMWIETIPYGETRNYVQNVLAYSVIYGYRMGQPTHFIADTERGSAQCQMALHVDTSLANAC